MRAHVETVAGSEAHRPHLVEEHERPDGSLLGGGEGAAHLEAVAQVAGLGHDRCSYHAVMVVGHEEQGHRGAFTIEREGKRLAELTYTVAGSRVILDHTSVDDLLRGTGAGRELVKAAVEWARANDRRLMPLCPYARSVFDKTPEYRDVLA
jgi:predicted GNAT family acetyltransferase